MRGISRLEMDGSFVVGLADVRRRGGGEWRNKCVWRYVESKTGTCKIAEGNRRLWKV